MKYFLYIFSIIFCFPSLAYGQNLSKKSTPPNIIIYLADDQNVWDYGVYGNNQVDTSNYDQLVREGMQFSNAYTAQAICAPSRSQLFTGLFPIKNGCMANHLPVKNVDDINDYFRELGYDVILAGKGHIKPFSVFNWTKFFPTSKNRALPIEDVKKFIEKTSKPYCVIFASDLPHGPFPKKNEYLDKPLNFDPSSNNNVSKIGKFKSGYYQNIKQDNDQLGRVFSMLKELSIFNDIVFMYMSDHGLKGKWSVRETGLKIPLVVRWPGKVKANSQNNKLVTMVDVLPTLIDLAGGDLTNKTDGISFSALLFGSESKIRDYVYGISTRQNIQSCYVFPSRSVRNSRYKYIRNYNALEVMNQNLGANSKVNAFIKRGANAFPSVPFEELYDLLNDPFEHHNLANDTKHTTTKETLAKELTSWMVNQQDFLVSHKMPLIRPTLHPLDRNSKWNNPDSTLIGTLSEEDYIELHY